MNPILFADFLTFRWLDAVDILLVALLLFQFHRLVKGTVAVNIFIGIVAVFILWKIVETLKMELLAQILGWFIGVGAIAIIIMFQQELRRFFLFIGTSELFNNEIVRKKIFGVTLRKIQSEDIDAVVKACKNMSETKTGAIVVFATKSDLRFFEQTGDIVQAKLTSKLLESIFYKNSPLHDGAVIVNNRKIQSARCVLPVTENPDFPAHLGMRHRAAVGITETSDAIAVAVSEQTGSIAFAKGGELQKDISLEKLTELLKINLY